MRENADALRLAKEVLLQRYLESLLRLPAALPSFVLAPASKLLHCCCRRGRRRSGGLRQLGQLVDDEMFSAAAAFRLTGEAHADGGTAAAAAGGAAGATLGSGGLKLTLVRSFSFLARR